MELFKASIFILLWQSQSSSNFQGVYDDWVLGPFGKIANGWETAKDRPLLPSLQGMRTLIVMTAILDVAWVSVPT